MTLTNTAIYILHSGIRSNLTFHLQRRLCVQRGKGDNLGQIPGLCVPSGLDWRWGGLTVSCIAGSTTVGSVCTCSRWTRRHRCQGGRAFNNDHVLPHRKTDLKETLSLFEDLYTNPGTIQIRDVKMLISLQTHDSMINFMKLKEISTLKIIKKGKKVQERTFDNDDELFGCVQELCGISF